jgi:tetratricopeptide (TPR) repeat protein
MRRILRRALRDTNLEAARRLVLLGRFDDAEGELRKALKRFPEDGEALLQLHRLDAARALKQADALWTEGLEDEGRRVLLEAVERAPAEPELQMRAAERTLGDPPRSLEHARRAVELAPQDTFLLYRAANVAAYHDALDVAGDLVERLDAVLADEPQFTQPFDTRSTRVRADAGGVPVTALADWMRGSVAAKAGDPRKAELALRRAFDAVPGHSAIAIELAELLATEGRRADALRVVKRGLHEAPQDEPLLELRAKLEAS